MIYLGTGCGTAFHINTLAPVITFQRAVKSQPRTLDAGKRREFSLQLLVHGWHRGHRVTCARGIKVEDIAVRRDDAEILVFQVPQTLRQ